MKSFGKCLLVLIIIGILIGGYFIGKKAIYEMKVADIKKGWYIEITYKDPINVRGEPNSDSKLLGTVNKGEVYKVLEVDTTSSGTYNWYKIEYEKTTGWVASGKKNYWVKDVNNPTDIAVPYIKYYDDVYKVATINDINYKHLEVIEDKEGYVITHKVYHEVKPSEGIDQYWILYTITDAVGKSSSKMQKIEFDVRPDESQVLDFKDYKRNAS